MERTLRIRLSLFFGVIWVVCFILFIIFRKKVPYVEDAISAKDPDVQKYRTLSNIFLWLFIVFIIFCFFTYFAL